MVVRPEFVPDPSLSREEMEQLQDDIAAAAVFEDDLGFDLANVRAGGETRTATQTTLGEGGDGPLGEGGNEPLGEGGDGPLGKGGKEPLVAGVDQAFHDGEAVSAVVLTRGGGVIERAHAVEPAAIPYIPGLLSFREGNAVLSALDALDREPDILLVDGSGRIHFREAGLATHVGVTLDIPTVGVAKSLLCGRPCQSLEDPLPDGTLVAIEADGDVTAPDGTVIGYTVQTRQFDSGNRHINPLYVSPGHRVGAQTAAELVLACAAGYKLPEPTRLADAHADEVKRES